MVAAIVWFCLAGPPDAAERSRDEFAPVEITAPGQTPPPADSNPSPPSAPTSAPAPERVDEVDEIPADESLEEDAPPEPPGDETDEEIREIVVDASILGRGNPLDVFTHAGGRTTVDKQEMKERGATSVGEALERKPGVRTVEGNSGQGSQDTKLQVAVRGVSPRLSQRATVLLDEVPIAPAPYGQPSLSLFPLSLFSIADVDVVRGGATSRYGPQTSGGVFNLQSNPIPEHPSVSVFAQADSNRDVSLGGAYGATHGRFGMYLEYAPRFGSSYREHSDKLVHGGLAKFAYQFNSKVRLESLTHGYYEDSELPGGLTRAAFDEDPFQSNRPFDWFRGMRVGSMLKLDVRLSDREDLKIAAWYNHSYRSISLASNPADQRDLVDSITTQPRWFNVGGIEPRWTRRFDARNFDFSHQLSLGARVAQEHAHLYWYREEFGVVEEAANVIGVAGAYAAYVGEKLIFLDGSLTLDVGTRLEVIHLQRRDARTDEGFRRLYMAPLPAASLWWEPVDRVAVFVAYGRSFGPPTYIQFIGEEGGGGLEPETSNSIEAGLKLLELGGVYAESTAWYKSFNNYLDEGLLTYDLIEEIHIWGVESEVSWYPGEVWEKVGELEFYAGYGWTGSRVVGLTYTGNIMPWYPVHEAWAGASYGFDFGLSLGVDFSYLGRQYTDFENRELEDPDAGYGPIPAYGLVNVWARVVAPLPPGWRLEFTGGVKNVGDTRYFSRTDDINRGILVGRPRTFYFNLGFAHDFVPKHLREQRSKRKRRAGKTTRRAALELAASGGLPAGL